MQNLAWIDPKTFLDLFALGNALPGPGSTQLAFSIAVVHHGVFCGLVAFLLWSLPGAIGMAGLGVGVGKIPEVLPGSVLALLTGLNAAAVGLIALAAVQLANGAVTDRITMGLVWISASLGICYHAPWMYPTLIAAGGMVSVVWDFRRVWIRRIGSLLKGRQRGEEEEVEMEVTTQTPASTSGPARTSQEYRRRNVQSRNGNGNTDIDIEAETTPTPIVEQGTEGGSSPLTVVSVKVAIALLVAFVFVLTVPLSTRAGLQNAGREVPRPLDLSGLSRTFYAER